MAAAARRRRFGYDAHAAYDRTVLEAGASLARAPSEPEQARSPFISVAIPTCDRPEDVARCLASLARVSYPRWEVILVDQSEGDESRVAALACGPLAPRLVYLRLEKKSVSAARNLAIDKAAGEILAFIDDDCTVEPDWLDRVRDVFAAETDAQLVFGSVVAADHDRHEFFVTAAEIRRQERLRGPLGAVRLRGIGASMYLRLEPGAMARFDPRFGAGARFPSGEEHDYAFGLLAAGGTVAQTPRITVTHHGARPYAGGVASSKVRVYLYAFGACHGKLLRRAAWRLAVSLIAANVTGMVIAIRPLNRLRGRPTHFGRFHLYLRGLRDGFAG
jgi:glycosyltransferase involved in cell wall biosynthesis